MYDVALPKHTMWQRCRHDGAGRSPAVAPSCMPSHASYSVQNREWYS